MWRYLIVAIAVGTALTMLKNHLMEKMRDTIHEELQDIKKDIIEEIRSIK